MDHSELIKSEASKLAEMHFCPEIKAENLASKEANSTLYGAGIGAGLGGLAGGLHGYVKNRGSMKDALKQSLLGALLGGGAGAGLGYAVGQGGKVLDEVAAEVKGSNPKTTSTPGKPAVDPNSFAAQNPNIAALSSDLKTVGSMGAGGSLLGVGATEFAGTRNPSMSNDIATIRGQGDLTGFTGSQDTKEMLINRSKERLINVIENELKPEVRQGLGSHGKGNVQAAQIVDAMVNRNYGKRVTGNDIVGIATNSVLDPGYTKIRPSAYTNIPGQSKLFKPRTWTPKARRITGGLGGGGLGILGGLGLNYLDQSSIPDA